MAPQPNAKPRSNPAFGLVLLLFALVVGLTAGFVLGRSTTDLNPGSDGPRKLFGGSYEEGYEAAHQRLLESGLVGQLPDAVIRLNGEVVSTGGGTLTLRPDPFWPDPLDRRIPEGDLSIAVGEATVITVITEKSPASFQTEVDAWLAAGEEGEAPRPYTEEQVALGDLKAGDRVSISTEDDVMTGEPITAVSIEKLVFLPPPEPEEELLPEGLPDEGVQPEEAPTPEETE